MTACVRTALSTLTRARLAEGRRSRSRHASRMILEPLRGTVQAESRLSPGRSSTGSTADFPSNRGRKHSNTENNFSVLRRQCEYCRSSLSAALCATATNGGRGPCRTCHPMSMEIAWIHAKDTDSLPGPCHGTVAGRCPGAGPAGERAGPSRCRPPTRTNACHAVAAAGRLSNLSWRWRSRRCRGVARGAARPR